MNRYIRLATLLALAIPLAACASSSGTARPEPSSTSHDMGSTSTMPMPSPQASASDTGSPMASMTPHDMGGMDGPAETVEIEIIDFGFTPAQLTIAPGTTVVVTNRDSAPHTFTAGSDDEPMPELFDSGLLEQGESFTFVFDEAGTFAYYCDRHPPMEGVIRVES